MNIVTTGRLRSGKNYVAQQAGCAEVALADPIKAFVDSLCPERASKNEKRKSYQDLGQWGRGTMTYEYPISTERITTVALARYHGADITGIGFPIDWAKFGSTEDFWLDLLVSRIDSITRRDCVAVTDCRFLNEFEKLMELRFVHFHVMASPATREKRCGEGFDPAVEENISERFAQQLDRYFLFDSKESDTMLPPPDRLAGTVVVWNDEDMSPPPELKCISTHAAVNMVAPALV